MRKREEKRREEKKPWDTDNDRGDSNTFLHLTFEQTGFFLFVRFICARGLIEREQTIR